jgi:hypothetical protein
MHTLKVLTMNNESPFAIVSSSIEKYCVLQESVCVLSSTIDAQVSLEARPPRPV